jgi:GNAT superfamily N-acetyltransferase
MLTDLSSPALARAVIANLLAFFRCLGHSPAAEFADEPPLYRWHTRLGHPWFSGVISRGPAPANASALIVSAQDAFQRRGSTSFTWWVDPTEPASDWDAALRAHGFSFDANTPGLAVALDAIDHGVPLPAGLEICPVEDLAMLKVWANVATVGSGLPPEMAGAFYDLLAGLGLDLPLRHYLGRLDGRPVATSSLFLEAGVAGVMVVATLPEARGRGLGAALTRAPLRAGLALGCRAGILQSSAMGLRIYERLGFKKVCDVGHYYWDSR